MHTILPILIIFCSLLIIILEYRQIIGAFFCRCYYCYIRRRFLPDIYIRFSRRVCNGWGSLGLYKNGAYDTIYLLPRHDYSDKYVAAYTFLHEIGHWTGHFSRLDRELVGLVARKGANPTTHLINYYKEELIADLVAEKIIKYLNLNEINLDRAAWQSRNYNMINFTRAFNTKNGEYIFILKGDSKRYEQPYLELKCPSHQKVKYYRQIIEQADEAVDWLVTTNTYPLQIVEKLKSFF